MRHSFFIILLLLIFSQCRTKEEPVVTQFAGKPEVPAIVLKEHEMLLSQIHAMTLNEDSTGRAAIKLEELMQHHFKEEEDYVLPPLGLLPLLAAGKLPGHSKEVIALTDELKLQADHLSAEHQMIKAFMDELMQVAVKENHPEVIEFEKALHRHALTEESILFPSAIMVGEYLKLKTKPDSI